MTKNVLIGFLMLMAMPFAAQAQDLLCPGDGADAAVDLPDSMGGVQADIERYALCIQRAQLLQQLDNVATTRAEMLRKAREPDDLLAAGGLNGEIPPMLGSSLPPVSGIDSAVSKLKPGETKIISAVGSALGATTKSLDIGIESAEWKTRRIWGQGLSIRAQISNGSGVLVNVTKGDPLPDGAVVEDISVRGVRISRNGKSQELSWEQLADTSDKAGAS